MTVVWSGQAVEERERLFRAMDALNPQAADRQDDAIAALVASLDGVASYQQLPDGTHWVPLRHYPIVVLYDRDPESGDVTVLDLAPTRSNWKP